MTTPNEPKVNIILSSGSSGGNTIDGGTTRIILPKSGDSPVGPPSGNITGDSWWRTFNSEDPEWADPATPIELLWTDSWRPAGPGSDANFGLIPQGGWESGFQPESFTVTINSGNDIGVTSPYIWLQVLDDLGNSLYFGTHTYSSTDEDFTFDTGSLTFGVDREVRMLKFFTNISTTSRPIISEITVTP